MCYFFTSKFDQNEFTTWLGMDLHRKLTKVLVRNSAYPNA